MTSSAMKTAKQPGETGHVTEHLRTPQVLLACVQQIGPIGLDPCAVRDSLVDALVEWHGPPHESEDGLARSWTGYGLVYCFPPPRQADVWVLKMAREARAGVEIVALVDSRTDAPWLHDFVFPTATAVCYLRDSLQAIGEPDAAPRAVVYWGERAERFREVFATAGFVVLCDDLRPEPPWTMTVMRPTPTGTWVKQQGRRSRAVRALMATYAAELVSVAVRCPVAIGRRRVIITRFSAIACSRESLVLGGALVEELLVGQRLLCSVSGYQVEWRQAVDRKKPRTEIRIEDIPASQPARGHGE